LCPACADPDNGIEPEKFDHEGIKAHKSATFTELRKLARRGRALLIYHHQTRRKGGHLREIDAIHRRLRANQLRPNGTLRIGPWSPRLLILVNATRAQIETARKFARRWAKEVLWFPDLLTTPGTTSGGTSQPAEKSSAAVKRLLASRGAPAAIAWLLRQAPAASA